MIKLCQLGKGKIKTIKNNFSKYLNNYDSLWIFAWFYKSQTFLL